MIVRFDRFEVCRTLNTDSNLFVALRDTLNRGQTFTLCIKGILPLLVLGNFVGLVLLALLAEGPASFRDVHLHNTEKNV